MLNKEELIYNSRSLVATWLNEKKNASELRLHMTGNNYDAYLPCSIEDCGEKLAKLLYTNNGTFNLVNLHAKVGGVDKIIGTLDVL